MKDILKNKELQRVLSLLEQSINPDTEEKLLEDWLDFTFDRSKSGLFCPERINKIKAENLPSVNVNDTLEDDVQSYVNMALSQYIPCLSQLVHGSKAVMNVRCNYGVGILPSLYGCEIFIMDRDKNTLPSSKPLTAPDAVQKLLDKGIPDLYAGLGKRVFTMAEIYREIAEAYPKIGKYVYVYHPDMQGPMDVAELVWGSELFYGLLDEPELSHSFLQLVTDTYLAFYREWEKFFPSTKDYASHWGCIHKGRIMLRNDSAMNLSPALIEEFVNPYDQRLLDELGGGAMHFCGKGDHYIGSYSTLKGLYAVNLTQPQYNDMEVIYKSTVDKGIKLLMLDNATAQKALDEGRDLHNCVSV